MQELRHWLAFPHRPKQVVAMCRASTLAQLDRGRLFWCDRVRPWQTPPPQAELKYGSVPPRLLRAPSDSSRLVECS